MFTCYVKFDFPPDPHSARMILGRICLAHNALDYTINDPLNYQQPVPLPYEQDASGLDLALARIKEGEQKIIADVATGKDVWVADL